MQQEMQQISLRVLAPFTNIFLKARRYKNCVIVCLNLQKKAFDSRRKEASWLTKNYGITFMSKIVSANVDCHKHFLCPHNSGVWVTHAELCKVWSGCHGSGHPTSSPPSHCASSNWPHHKTSCLWRRKTEKAPEWGLQPWTNQKRAGLCLGLWNQNVKTFWLACAGLDLVRVEEERARAAVTPCTQSSHLCTC